MSILQTTESATGGGRNAPSRSLRWLVQEIRAFPLPYLCILLFVLATFVIATARGDTFFPVLLEYMERVKRTLVLIGSVIVIGLCVRSLAQGRQRSPVSALVGDLSKVAGSGKPVRFLFACLVLALMMAAFLYNKMLIPELIPFQWDATFARLDSVLFFGSQPWKLLHPVLGTTPATFFLDIVYSSWVPMVFLFWAGAFASQRVPQPIRIRYWMATIISWVVIGLLMATALSSAGPVYFSEVVDGVASPYTDLNKYLADISSRHLLSSSLTKESLWLTYTGQSSLPGGISAMPSMHNAQAALFVAFAYSIGRRFGRCMLLYALLIFVGSIHLGWHYAVDGIVGVAAALMVWAICSRFGKQAQADAPSPIA